MLPIEEINARNASKLETVDDLMSELKWLADANQSLIENNLAAYGSVVHPDLSRARAALARAELARKKWGEE